MVFQMKLTYALAQYLADQLTKMDVKIRFMLMKMELLLNAMIGVKLEILEVSMEYFILLSTENNLVMRLVIMKVFLTYVQQK